MPEAPSSSPENALAEAAVWLARLRSEDRSLNDEAALRSWLAESPLNASAFEKVMSTWDVIGGARPERPKQTQDVRNRDLPALPAVALLFVVLIAVGMVRWAAAPATYRTAIGEHRSVQLADGSTIRLDSDTRLSVKLSDERRLVVLDGGRAHFKVAPEPSRPFIVQAADRQVVALGTVFDVSVAARLVSVMLYDGRVAVEKVSGKSGDHRARVLTPGDRLLVAGEHDRLDKPPPERESAWLSGRLVFDDVSLDTAVSQMNRYSPRKLVVAEPSLAGRRISGIYEARDPKAFAHSVSLLFVAPIRETSGEIIIGNGEPEHAR